MVVVDNSVSDDCADVAAAHGVELVRPSANVGFGRGVNAGLAHTTGGADFVFVLNADTEVRPGAIGALIDHLIDHPRAAVAGPLLVDARGRSQPSCGRFPTSLRTLLAQSGLWRPFAALSRRRDARPLTLPTASGSVEWVLGAALMLDRRAVEAVGGFDPGFHMYFEEVDLSRRLRSARRETHFVAEAVVAHEGGASTSREKGAMERVMYASLARHMRLHGRSARLWGLRAVVATVAGAHLLRSRAASQPPGPWRDIVRDALDGWTE